MANLERKKNERKLDQFSLFFFHPKLGRKVKGSLVNPSLTPALLLSSCPHELALPLPS